MRSVLYSVSTKISSKLNATIFAASPNVFFLIAGYASSRGIAQNLIAGIVPRVMVVNWFRRMRGRAIGLTGTAHPVGTFALAPAALLIIDAGLTWRWVWVLFGIAILILLVVPNALILRRTPEEMGLLPDGDKVISSTEAEERTARELADSWTFKEAIRTPALGLILASIILPN